VRAVLAPSDALSADDAAVLDLAPLRARRVGVDPECPAPWQAAVAMHPALVAVDPGASAVDVLLACGPTRTPARAPTLWVRADTTPVALRGALRWARSAVTAVSAVSAATAPPRAISGPGPADPSGLVVAATLAPEAGDEVLLAIGASPVIVQRAGTPGQLETSLALDVAARTAAAPAPLLVNWMFERLLDAPLLDATALMDRGPGAAQVVPSRPAAADSLTPAAEVAWTGASRALLLAAAAVLLWELAALARQGARLRERAPARAP
jgi:hypothetical protein